MSQHDWIRDKHGEIEAFEVDDSHSVARCRACGGSSVCLHSVDARDCGVGEYGLAAEDCEGVNLNLTVEITVRHPGEAHTWADRNAITKRIEIPMTLLLASNLDLVAEELAYAVEDVAGEWRTQRDRYRDDWRAAAQAATGGQR